MHNAVHNPRYTEPMIAAGGGISKNTHGIFADGAPHAMNSPGTVISVSTIYEINIGGVPYHSAAEIARKYGFVRDYVARLCREGKVRGRRLGKLWYVDTESFAAFVRRNENSGARQAAHPMV
jgi:hypothetical protein